MRRGPGRNFLRACGVQPWILPGFRARLPSPDFATIDRAGGQADIMTIELDSRDRSILRILQQDGRITNSDLAEKVHLSPSACLRRVRQLEESGLIRGYAMMLDDKTAGFPGTAFVFVTLDQQGRASLESFEQAVQDLPEILECHLLAGAHDYLMRVIYRDSADFERIHTDILTQLPGVTRVQSTLTLRTIKKTSALPV